MNIGHKISSCRKEAKLSQEALASKLNISRQAVSRWETGDTIPETEKIIQLSKLFNVSTDYLLLEENINKQINHIKDNQSQQVIERRRQFRIRFGITTLVIGIITLLVSLVLAGIWSLIMTEWYTSWGRFGTALFRTWRIIPLLLGIGLTIYGAIVLWKEYKKID